MVDDKLHPSVKDFKTFMNKHPKLVAEVRRSGKGWQDYYEKWALLGEDDPLWEGYKGNVKTKSAGSKKEGKKELFGQLMKLSENIDLDKVQQQVTQINDTITTVQDVLGQFQTEKTPQQQFTNLNHSFNRYRD